MRNRGPLLCLLASLALGVSNGVARAQPMLEVPAPGQQQAPNFTPGYAATPRAVPPPSAPSQPLELAPQAAAPPPSLQVPPLVITIPLQALTAPQPLAAPAPQPQMIPVLPAVFRGCWQGQVDMLDENERLPGALHKVGFWTPKTYRLCYRRVGGGPFKLTFSETGIVPSEKIVNARGRVDPLATDGRAWAKMRSMLHFDELPPGPFFSGPTFAVDENTTLDCRIESDQMLVNADVYGTRDGEPWFRARWHANFRQVPQ
ncbi:MAG TPA: hypothetical protein VIX59_20385 [Candidatus Binataceae bacterium]